MQALLTICIFESYVSVVQGRASCCPWGIDVASAAFLELLRASLLNSSKQRFPRLGRAEVDPFERSIPSEDVCHVVSIRLHESSLSIPQLLLLGEVFAVAEALASKPITLPIHPEGFGTGHSLASCSSLRASSWNILNVAASCSRDLVAFLPFPCWGRSLGSSPAARSCDSPSRYCRLGRGHGKRCGMLTTTNEARRVPANRVEVAVERGCRSGGILKSRRPHGGGSACTQPIKTMSRLVQTVWCREYYCELRLQKIR